MKDKNRVTMSCNQNPDKNSILWKLTVFQQLLENKGDISEYAAT